MQIHLERKNDSRNLMKDSAHRAQQIDELCAINFDLQKILSTPKSTISSMYYLSKLCIWNFTIHELATKKGFCNIWNETVGRRGSNEIASFLYDYLLKKIAAGKKEFHLYSDNCGGQNRNKNVLSMLMKVALDHNVTVIQRQVN